MKHIEANLYRLTEQEVAKLTGSEVNGNINLKNIPTCQLVEELKRRDGVEFVEIAPYVEYELKVYDGDGEDNFSDEGPAIILKVFD